MKLGPQILTGLRSFEAAARCGSLAAAGEELGVSASAVSQQVKSLEARIGVALFDRKPQSLSLTTPAKKLLANLTNAFELIEHSLTGLKPPQKTITLSMPAVFAAGWFLPRMRRFHESYSRFDVVPRSSGDLLEPSLDGVDYAVRFGKAGWKNLDCRFIFGECLRPMSSPRYSLLSLNSNPHRLLVAEGQDSIWEKWSEAVGSSFKSDDLIILGDQSLVMQAALNGHGIALLDEHVVSLQLSEGSLVALPDAPTWQTGEGWFLVFEEQPPHEESLTALLDWMLSEASNTPQTIDD